MRCVSRVQCARVSPERMLLHPDLEMELQVVRKSPSPPSSSSIPPSSIPVVILVDGWGWVAVSVTVVMVVVPAYPMPSPMQELELEIRELPPRSEDGRMTREDRLAMLSGPSRR